MPNAAEIRWDGIDRVTAAFEEVRREVLKEMRPALRAIGQKVSKDAQNRASSEIANIGNKWNRMRVGVTLKGVYVAPASRRRGGSPRRNLGGLLMTRAMQPALDANKELAYAEFDALIDRAKDHAGF